MLAKKLISSIRVPEFLQYLPFVEYGMDASVNVYIEYVHLLDGIQLVIRFFHSFPHITKVISAHYLQQFKLGDI
jgi:hypothetical protein